MGNRNVVDVLGLIENQEALGKVLSVPFDSNRCLDFLLNQLKDPVNQRPLKNVQGLLRHRFFNPKSGEWIYRSVENQVRGLPKQTVFTKKTGTTLLPYDGKIKLHFPKHMNPVGLLFDLKLCHLKDEKYIFMENGDTDTKWWVKQVGDDESTKPVLRSVSLKTLQYSLRNARDHNLEVKTNECLVGLSLASLQAVFAVQDTIEGRLQALYAKKRIRELLNIDLPILIITVMSGVKIYDLSQQTTDMAFANRWDQFVIPLNFLYQKLEYKPEEVKGESFKNFRLADVKHQDHQHLILDYLGLDDLLQYQFYYQRDPEAQDFLREIDKKISRNRLSDLMDLLGLMKEAKLLDEIQSCDEKLNADDLMRPHDFVSYLKLFSLNQKGFDLIKEGLDEMGLYVYDQSQAGLQQGRGSPILLKMTDLIVNRKAFLLRILAHMAHAKIHRFYVFETGHMKNQPYSQYHFRCAVSGPGCLDVFNQIIRFCGLPEGFHFPSQISYLDADTRMGLFLFCPASDLKKWELDVLVYGYKPRTYEGTTTYHPVPQTKVKAYILLLAALENHQSEFIQLLIAQYPEALIPVLKIFRCFFSKSKEQSDKKVLEIQSYVYRPFSDEVYANLLLQLNENHLKNFELNDTEKRLIESSLEWSFQKFHTSVSLKAFWEKQRHAPYLNQHRHSIYDRFFRDKHYLPKSKTKLEEAYWRRFSYLSDYENSVPSLGVKC